MKLKKIIEIKGTIKILTGLHIGMGNQEIHIGGIDNPVIKHPITNEPYIPGSSLKGKMRTLLEYKLVGFLPSGKPYCPADDPKYKDKTKEEKQKLVESDPISRIFGSSNTAFSTSGPTRLVVRDSFLCGKYKEKIDDPEDDFNVYSLLEGKWENTIDRKKGTALNPRQTERVAAGTEFKLNILYKVFDDDDEKNFELVKEALKLVENDALGGSGSRGYGRVKFEYEVIEHEVE